MMGLKLLTLSLLSVSAIATVVKVPAGKTPTPTPCVETGAKGEEKCVVPTAPALNAEPKLELPETKKNKSNLETPRAKKK